MSIQDTYLDIHADMPTGILKKQFEEFARWAFTLEDTLETAIQEVEQHRTTMRTMIGLDCPPEIRIAYKLLHQRADGSLGPLFINRSQQVPVGLWMHAEAHRTKGYAFRPGWHVLLKPEAPHLKKTPKNEKRVWTKVAVVDYEVKIRPESQGGKWLLAQKMIVLEVIG